MRTPFAVLLLAFLFAAASVADQIEPSKPRRQSVATVKYTRGAHGELLVPAKINGKTGMFILRTGTPYSLLRQPFAAKTGLEQTDLLRMDGTPEILPGAGGPVRRMVSPVASLGRANVYDARFYVPGVDIGSAPGDLDGVIGVEPWGIGAFLLDFAKKEVEIYLLGRLTEGELRELGFHGAPRVPFTNPVNRVAPRVAVRLNGMLSEPMIVDTGSMLTHISGESARRLSLRTLRTDLEVTSALPGSKPVEVTRVRVDRMTLGGVELKDVEVGYTTDDAPGVLGMDVLEKCRVFIDFEERAIHFAAAAPVARKPVTREPAVDLGTSIKAKILVLYDTAFAVEGTLGGRKYVLLIDLAAPRSSFDRLTALLDKLELSSNDGRTVVAEPLRVGDSAVPVRGVPLFLNDLSKIRSLTPEVSGIIGADLLNAYVVSLDLSTLSLSLVAPTDEEQVRKLAGSAMPGKLEDINAVPYIHGELDGLTVKFRLATMFAGNWVVSTELRSRLRPLSIAEERFVDGNKVEILRIKSLSVGGRTGEVALQHLVGDPESVPCGELGARYLRGFVLTLDRSRGRAYVVDRLDKKAAPERWAPVGISPGSHRDGGIPVIAVVYPSQASEAGVAPGDLILTFNGKAVVGMSLRELERLIKAEKGKTIRFRIKGPSGEREVKLRPRPTP